MHGLPNLKSSRNVFKEFLPIVLPTQHQLPIFHSAVTVFRCQLLHVMGFLREKIQVFLYHRTYRVPSQSTFASGLTCWFTPAADEHIPHKRHVLLRSGCGWTAISGRSSITEPVFRSFEWQFLIVSWRIVAFFAFTVRHQLCTATTEFHTS